MSETPRELTPIEQAVVYAMRCGCFFPVPQPPRGSTVEAWIQWGAMRNLHTKVAETLRVSS
jgi:hypothetical protein